MLDGFAAHTHDLRVLIEPRLRGLDDVFVFPAFDAALVGRCALILERACPARLRQVNPPIVPVTLSQETLAEMIGTTRSRVSFFMNKFRRLGLIDYNGKIDVHQSLLNSVLHDKPEIMEAEPA
jgi:CRP-like cAMP-binding protein